MMRFPAILIALCLAPVGVYSQSEDVKRTQKKLEKLLFSKTPHVKRARFTGCNLELNATIPPDGKFDPVSGRVPSITPTEAVYTSSVDSAGTKGVVVFELDMSKVSSSSVVVKTTAKDKLMSITLEAKQDGGVNQ